MPARIRKICGCIAQNITNKQTSKQANKKNKQTYITLHYIALHYITLHYTTLHYIYITYIHTIFSHIIFLCHTRSFTYNFVPHNCFNFSILHYLLCLSFLPRHPVPLQHLLLMVHTHTAHTTYHRTTSSHTGSLLHTPILDHLFSLSCISHAIFTFLLLLVGRSWHVGLSGPLISFFNLKLGKRSRQICSPLHKPKPGNLGTNIHGRRSAWET